jgi:hypothetical protein
VLKYLAWALGKLMLEYKSSFLETKALLTSNLIFLVYFGKAIVCNMKFKKILIIGVISLSIIILITLSFAPSNNQKQKGSTYNRQPDGYAAWFEYMSEKGIKLTRWQSPFPDLLANQNKTITLLKIQPSFSWFSLGQEEKNWLQQGNNLIVLGIKEYPTLAKFSTIHHHETGIIKIDTTRRGENPSPILGDKFGAIVWQEKIGKGELTKIITPYFAANAYQDYAGNYQFLEKLLTQYNQPIFIDEYIHGYKDQEIIQKEFGDSLISYFWQTPLQVLIIQGLVLFLICLWGLNHRFGPKMEIYAPKINNTQAYIEALAGVLEKAESSDFLLDIIGKEEQIQLQKKLGLGNKLLSDQALIDAWQNQSQNKLALESLLKLQSSKRHLKETDLLNWLKGWQKILNFNSKSTE